MVRPELLACTTRMRVVAAAVALVASCSGLSAMPRDDKQVGLWLLDQGRSPAEVLEGTRFFLERATSSEAPDALALCMCSWAACASGASLVDELCDAVAPRIADAVDASPRFGEVLANTARAFAVSACGGGASPPRRFEAVFVAIAAAAKRRPRDLDYASFATVSRSFAAAKEAGAYGGELWPLGDGAPAEVAAAAHAALARAPGLARVGGGGGDGFAAYAAEGFVSRADADELLELAAPLWEKSRVHGAEAYRTSDTASLRDEASRASETVARVSERAAALFGLPATCCETLQLVRYTGPTMYYKPHCDLLDDEAQVLLGGQRLGTVLVYLSDVPAGCGGETNFDDVGARVRPEFGKAVAWANVAKDGGPELRSRHSALPLVAALDGDGKVAVNCWIRAFPGANEL